MNYRKHLTEDILPFWLEHAIDEECGGILHISTASATSTAKKKKAVGFREGRFTSFPLPITVK